MQNVSMHNKLRSNYWNSIIISSYITSHYASLCNKCAYERTRLVNVSIDACVSGWQQGYICGNWGENKKQRSDWQNGNKWKRRGREDDSSRGEEARTSVMRMWVVRHFTWAWARWHFNRIYNTCKVGHRMGVLFPVHEAQSPPHLNLSLSQILTDSCSVFLKKFFLPIIAQIKREIQWWHSVHDLLSLTGCNCGLDVYPHWSIHVLLP